MLSSLKAKRAGKSALAASSSGCGSASVPGAPRGDEEVVEVADQAALKRAVNYTSKGAAALAPAAQKMLDHILATCAVPAEFELDKVRYGPLSGQSFEERLITAYESGLLEPAPPRRSASARRGASTAALKSSPAAAAAAAASTSGNKPRGRRSSGASAAELSTAPSTPARPSAPARRGATPERGAAAASAVHASSPALELTPLAPSRTPAAVAAAADEAVDAASASDEAAPAARRVMCAECAADGHWRWNCPERYRRPHA